MREYKLKLSFCHPKFWLAWISILLLFLSSLLPYSCLLFLGKWLGRGAYFIVKKRAQIARRNLALCFPSLSTLEIEEKVKRNFENSGIALFEMGMAWFWPSWRVHKRLKITGIEHLQQANAQDKGILFMGAHFLTIEMGARALGLLHPSYAVYRPHSNAVLDYWFYKGRMREHKAMLDRTDFKSMLRVLKKGNALWYAPDHDYGPHRSNVFAPFFAVENANTVSGTSTLARIKNTCVIPVFLKRLPASQGYELIFYKALENFPSKDTQADAAQTNQQIENMVLECDEQYMWMHRRFKTRPDGEASLYL
ncbi:lipid A biosynthesis lauroyl (or palmitoleoyl) acyltransferase [Psychromonas sp. CNPT3]|uniref:LpxL/LpxP family Kdo(2)-lipid IV(A) lauroyl/palmitoleoyl acyltransferase n=1 Tax=Psychromonas sp. CNPT3 TaxID=314282 RepID=UPI00006E509C|nr:LpxL/LpxP family Kdo(2)-lipid IV(A) lauroyl/palmitoleoyl acyltransferase [Psychromonas sp. CNPT3]AGH82445.1 lipid A biosynthesis lauroyl (or palmitoleoyl) acyltransferase [Psychromonas sp. CNPT3]